MGEGRQGQPLSKEVKLVVSEGLTAVVKIKQRTSPESSKVGDVPESQLCLLPILFAWCAPVAVPG